MGKGYGKINLKQYTRNKHQPQNILKEVDWQSSADRQLRAASQAQKFEKGALQIADKTNSIDGHTEWLKSKLECTY